MKPVLALDFDDVMAQWMPYFCKWHNETFSTHVRSSDITSFELWKHLECTPEQFRARHLRFRAFYESSEILPVEGAPEAIAQLSEHFALALVTARNESDRDLTERWLKKFIPARFDYYLFGNTSTENHKPKGQLCNSINAVCLVDDHLDNILSVAKEPGIKKAILFNFKDSYGWSHLNPVVESVLGHNMGKVVIVHDWTEAANEILELIEFKDSSVSTVAAVSPTSPSSIDIA
eukprot:Gregarina_sp_Poly_1__3984@NODE_21_length_20913_cov_102_783268_g19_i0_p10_GENE_NODE_21_length_20913_cov_102_783268_g19_i0NODE_21_length_20913_cov_102_783268_g19_i0_p10_ORF_typecomplete_len233_score35_13NT5C/PF06941_12/5_2e26HAD_2/PF13419_6/1_2e06Acid_phosphat_B/PF03767_14/6_9e05DUF2608/PF11019_8/5_6DUF2608/PF11019_8/9_3_NODE_21_length_20913_cov_102_783268_g19_i01432715025